MTIHNDTNSQICTYSYLQACRVSPDQEENIFLP